MSTEINPAEKREGYDEAPRVAKESSTSKTTYYRPAPDPKALRDVSVDPRAKMAGASISADGHIDPVGVKVGAGGRDFDPAYEVVRDATIANAIMPDEELLAYDSGSPAVKQVIERAERKANTREFDKDDPDSPAHNRHVDEVMIANSLYTVGQNTDRLLRRSKEPTGYKGDVNVKAAGYPAFTNNGAEEGSYTSFKNYDATTLSRSNFRHQYINITIEDGELKSFNFDGAEYPVKTDPSYVDRTAMATVNGDRHVSDAYMTIQNKTADGKVRTPFVKNMLDPLAILRLLRDVTLDTGAVMAMATRTLNQAIAYQIFNQKAKTGGNAVANLQRMLLDCTGAADHEHTAYESSDPYENVCSHEACAAGSPALFVRELMSKTRCCDHHTFITYDGGVAGYAKKLNGNIHNFWAHRGFINAMQQTEIYSTVEGSVSPANPIWMTCQHDLFSPMDWNCFCTFGSTVEVSRINDSVVSEHGLISPVLARYTLDDNIQEYLGVGHPIVTGIFECLTSPATKHKTGAAMLAAAAGKTKGTLELNIPIAYSTIAPTSWQLLLAMASDYIVGAQDDYLDALVNNPFVGMAFDTFEPDAMQLSTGSVFAADSYVLTGWNKPIQPKVMTDLQRLRYCVPEDFSSAGVLTLDGMDGFNKRNVFSTPWYIMASDHKMGALESDVTTRNVDGSEPDQIHVPNYGIVGLKTDVVARAMTDATLDKINAAYGAILDLRAEDKNAYLLPFARSEYQTVRVVTFSNADNRMTLKDVWCMPRSGDGFLQMPGYGFLPASIDDDKHLKIAHETIAQYDGRPARAYTYLTVYHNVADQNMYGRTVPAGTLFNRLRKVENADSSAYVRAPGKNAATKLVGDLNDMMWPRNRSIVGEKPFDDTTGKVYSLIGMLVEHPLYAYLGIRGSCCDIAIDDDAAENCLVDNMAEMYAAGLLVSVQNKYMIPDAVVFDSSVETSD